jgi:cytochrome c peroxidase
VNNRAVVQTREPATITFLDDLGSPIELPGESMADTGHFLFHHAASDSSFVSCAGCHPEGRDDGKTWNFAPIGPRRTQNLGGDVISTAPFHWDGDLDDLNAIMGEVFVKRMGGLKQGPRHINAFSLWLSKVPAVPSSPRGTIEQIEHGKQLFNDQVVGCASCHSGSHYSNNLSADVGTGRKFQVPQLRSIATRAPYMHDGCAATLRDRFTASATCTGGDNHGKISHLSDAEIDDLVAYLETL